MNPWIVRNYSATCSHIPEEWNIQYYGSVPSYPWNPQKPYSYCASMCRGFDAFCLSSTKVMTLGCCVRNIQDRMYCNARVLIGALVRWICCIKWHIEHSAMCAMSVMMTWKNLCKPCICSNYFAKIVCLFIRFYMCSFVNSCELIVFVSGQADKKKRIVSIFMT